MVLPLYGVTTWWCYHLMVLPRYGVTTWWYYCTRGITFCHTSSVHFQCTLADHGRSICDRILLVHFLHKAVCLYTYWHIHSITWHSTLYEKITFEDTATYTHTRYTYIPPEKYMCVCVWMEMYVLWCYAKGMSNCYALCYAKGMSNCYALCYAKCYAGCYAEGISNCYSTFSPISRQSIYQNVYI